MKWDTTTVLTYFLWHRGRTPCRRRVDRAGSLWSWMLTREGLANTKDYTPYSSLSFPSPPYTLSPQPTIWSEKAQGRVYNCRVTTQAIWHIVTLLHAAERKIWLRCHLPLLTTIAISNGGNIYWPITPTVLWIVEYDRWKVPETLLWVYCLLQVCIYKSIYLTTPN